MACISSVKLRTALSLLIAPLILMPTRGNPDTTVETGPLHLSLSSVHLLEFPEHCLLLLDHLPQLLLRRDPQLLHLAPKLPDLTVHAPL
jgi:hypothetical protein